MPRNKNLKRVVRTRMEKTGESYTAARAHIIQKSSERQPQVAPEPSTSAANYADLAGMSDEKIAAKTGCTWEQWVHALDRHDAAAMSHTEVAALVHEKYRIDGWWSQTVTVGYERIKGLRERGQRRDGSYEVGKSKTLPVPIATLFDAWADAGARRRWLTDADPHVRTATAPRSMRLGWPDGTIVVVGFTDKGDARSSVAVQHTKLPDRAAAERMKRYWSERLAALGEEIAKKER